MWAFGALLFEMLTGEPLFGGETVSETLAAVIKDDARLDRLPAALPPSVRRLLARCLERDAKLRLRDIGEARIVLGQPRQNEDAVPGAPSSRVPWRIAWALAGGGVLLGALGAVAAWRAMPVAERPMRQFELPPAIASAAFAIAPDGSRVVYVADGHLRVRMFDSREVRDLGPVHSTARRLAWSPDGSTIAFTAEGRLRSMPATGGPVFDITRLPGTGRANDIAWRSDGVIFFSAWRGAVYRVSASGGSPDVFVPLNTASEIDFHSLAFAPEGRLLVTTHTRTQNAHAVELVGPVAERKVLLADTDVAWVRRLPQGQLLVSREGSNQGVWAVPWNGGPIDLTRASRIQAGDADFDAAGDGSLLVLMRPPPPKSELVWLDRRGGVATIAGASFSLAGDSGNLSLSPDGRRVGMYVTSASGKELVVRDLPSGTDSRLGAREAADVLIEQQRPCWFPSGDQIVHTAGSLQSSLHVVAYETDGSGTSRELAFGSHASVSADGRYLIFLADDAGKSHVRYAPFQPDGGLGPARPLFKPEAEQDVHAFDLSPDGSLLAYMTRNEEGLFDIVATRFPSGEGRFQVIAGGVGPRFSPDGRRALLPQPASVQPNGATSRAPQRRTRDCSAAAPIRRTGDRAGRRKGIRARARPLRLRCRARRTRPDDTHDRA